MTQLDLFRFQLVAMGVPIDLAENLLEVLEAGVDDKTKEKLKSELPDETSSYALAIVEDPTSKPVVCRNIRNLVSMVRQAGGTAAEDCAQSVEACLDSAAC